MANIYDGGGVGGDSVGNVRGEEELQAVMWIMSMKEVGWRWSCGKLQRHLKNQSFVLGSMK